MNNAYQRIHSFLEALVVRERRQLLVRSGLHVVAGGLVAWMALSVGLSAGIERSGAAGLSVFVGVLLVVAGIYLPAVWRWRQAGELNHQARRVEAARPALRGALSAVVDRAVESGAKPAPAGVSQVLLSRAAARTVSELGDAHPAEFLPAKELRASVLMAGGLTLLLGGLGAVLPIGPLDALRVVAGSSAAEVRMTSDNVVVGDEKAVVGDITLLYVFPEYTGIASVEVPNSDGSIHAPPGTRVDVTARTAEGYDAVALEVDGEPLRDAKLLGGRDIRSSMVVEGEGSWRFVLFRGEEVHYSASYSIRAEDDSPPVVAVERAPSGGVPLDRGLGIGWSVQDDFGIQRVVLEVIDAEGAVREHVLREPLDPTLRLSGGVRTTPRQLGLKAGQSITLRIAAFDNDLRGGSKRGVSADIQIDILGASGRARQLRQQSEQLRNLMLDALAELLVEEVPPASGPRGMSAWSEAARGRLEPIQEVRRQIWGEGPGSGLQAELVDEVLADGARLVRFALTTWEVGTRRQVTAGDRAAFARLHAEHVDGLERGIYVLDQILQQAARQELARELMVLSREAVELADMAENVDAQEILARLDQLERLMERMSQLASRLDEGSLKEFVNSRADEAQSLMDEARRAVAEGRLDDARELLEQLSERLQQLSENIQDDLASRQQGEDSLQEAYDEAMNSLSSLAEQQRQLEKELAEARAEHGGGVDEQVAMWKEVDRLARRARDNAAAMPAAAGDGTGFRTDTVRWFEKLALGVARVHDAVLGREAERALERLDAAMRPLRMAERMAQLELERARAVDDLIPAGATVARNHGQQVRAALEAARPLLEELANRGQTEAPEVQQAAREMADRQGALEERAAALQREVQRIEQAMPSADGKASQAMQEAGDAMNRAGASLRDGQAMQAGGHQADGARRVDEAREQLERQMQNHQQMQQSIGQMGRGQQQGGPEGDGSERSGGSSSDGDGTERGIELPLAESFQTPEDYRRALLEGMESDVPDEFEALKRRYYEELVRQ